RGGVALPALRLQTGEGRKPQLGHVHDDGVARLERRERIGGADRAAREGLQPRRQFSCRLGGLCNSKDVQVLGGVALVVHLLSKWGRRDAPQSGKAAGEATASGVGKLTGTA